MSTVYEIVTNRILEMLEKGVIPWARPWRGGELSPRSLMTGHAYRGINVLLTGCQSYESPYWLTYRQALEVGAQVRRGEKGTPIVFWSTRGVEDQGGTQKEGKKKEIPIIRFYTVFNVAQVEGLKLSRKTLYPGTLAEPQPPIEWAERIARDFKGCPEIREGMDHACYRPSDDVIEIPSRESFTSSEGYYSVLFHEMTHATGASGRLNRDTLRKIAAFGDHSYSQEELVAELGSAYLCAEAGIGARVIENQASYIDGWVRALKADSRAVITASAQAQKAVDWILEKRAVQESSETVSLDAVVTERGTA